MWHIFLFVKILFLSHNTVIIVYICVLLTAFYPFKVTIAYIVIKDITVKMGSKRACADIFVKITHPRFAQLHALEQLTF